MSTSRAKIKLPSDYKRIIKISCCNNWHECYRSNYVIVYEECGEIKRTYYSFNRLNDGRIMGEYYAVTDAMIKIYSIKFYDDCAVFCLKSNKHRMFKIKRTKYVKLEQFIENNKRLIYYLDMCNKAKLLFEKDDNPNYMSIIESCDLYQLYYDCKRTYLYGKKNSFTSSSRLSEFMRHKIVRQAYHNIVKLIKKYEE